MKFCKVYGYTILKTFPAEEFSEICFDCHSCYLKVLEIFKSVSEMRGSNALQIMDFYEMEITQSTV